MFGIGSMELVVILLVALIVLGPKNLAGITRTVGKAMGEFRRISTDFQRTLNAEAAQEEKTVESERKKGQAASSPSGRDDRVADGNGAASPCPAEEAKASVAGPTSDMPPDSPLAEALAKVSAEAEAAETEARENGPAQSAHKGGQAA
ncbi:MAG: twin-arginine translocase TatA/TatE family subunit [Desulfovibrio sp.]|jgi:sec-independent protein translocase protein TatB|nr:twin-arginine translocase TatA/TatE family subunit [Desulfovibrio sp.]